MCKLKPILAAWMEVADKEDYKPCVGWASNRFCARVDVTNLDRVQRQRRRRAVFEKNVLITLEKAFNANPRPTVEELDCISESLQFEKEIVRIWFCNRRAKIQRALKTKLMEERRLVEVRVGHAVGRHLAFSRFLANFGYDAPLHELFFLTKTGDRNSEHRWFL